MDMNDQEIISLYFDRDEQAIKETDTKYGKTCMQVSMNILHSHPDAEECVSDTYLKTWNSIPPQRPNSLCAFVCRIVRNLSLNRLKELTAAKRDRELTPNGLSGEYQKRDERGAKPGKPGIRRAYLKVNKNHDKRGKRAHRQVKNLNHSSERHDNGAEGYHN